MRLATRREGYVLELMRVPASAATGDAARGDDLDALRAWLRSLGAAWLEAVQGDRAIIELRIPRRSIPLKSETPCG